MLALFAYDLFRKPVAVFGDHALAAAGPLYCSSLTCSIHVTCLPSSASWVATWTMLVVGAAPCQCFSFGGIQTTSPALISRTLPPQLCTRPAPETTNSVWPSGCVCQAVRAPGSKRTKPERTRAGAGASMIGSCHTVPVKLSAGARRVGREPQL